VPVIFMTGLSETEQIVQGFEAGGVDYVVKPIRIPEVLARLARHMHNASVGRLARAAIDVAGMGTVLLDRQGRFAWRSPQATAWLEQAFAGERAADAAAEWLQGAIAQGRVGIAFAKGMLQAQYLGQVGIGEAMFVLTATAESATVQRLRDAALTPRETEVLGWLAKGKTNRDIAEILGLSPRTVNKHLEHVFEKLGVETRAAAAAIAAALGGEPGAL
jgi:DNA-binding CsgD family transcriptional regulator